MAAKKPLFNRQMRRISELDANIQAGLAREEAERAKQAEAEIETVDYTPEQIAALDPALFEPAGFNRRMRSARAIPIIPIGRAHSKIFGATRSRAC